MTLLEDTLGAIGPADLAAGEQAERRQVQLTKPPGSLGALEDVGVRPAALTGTCPTPLPTPAVVAVVAADHGVTPRA